jgi:non-homologous end joining protein Ku
MAVSINDIEVADNYQMELRKLVEAKLRGKEFKQAAVKPSAATPDLMAALKQSLAQKTVSKKPMQKATGKKKPAAAQQRKQA